MGRKKKIDEAVEEQVMENVKETIAEEIEQDIEDTPIDKLNKMEEAKRFARMEYVEDLGFRVIRKLNAEELNSIANFVSNYSGWSERFYAKAVITLNVATDLTKEEIDNIIANVDFIEYPFINTVYSNIFNWYLVEEAITYYQSTEYIMNTMLREIISIAGSGNKEVEEKNEEVKRVLDFARKEAEE